MNWITQSAFALIFSFTTQSQAAVLKVGDRAPSFTLTGADGKTYGSKDLRDHVVVLEWYNKDCPFVRKFYDAKVMQTWQSQHTTGPNAALWFTIASSASGKQGFMTPTEAAQIRQEQGMNNTTLLLDPRGAVGRQFAVKATPQVFVITRKGRIAYQGAVDDRPSAQPATLAGATNYLLDALNAVRADRSVKTASTTPYGCGVKY